MLLPDPYDCLKYYICVTDLENPIEATCDGNKIFDYETGACRLESEGAKCYDFCDPCDIYCVVEGKIPNPVDCTSYYYCEPPDGLALFNCPEGFYYDEILQICQDMGSCTNLCPSGTTTLEYDYSTSTTDFTSGSGSTMESVTTTP